MTVSAVSSATASTASAARPAVGASLSYNDFLTLLMAQLKNQDPTHPMDPSQMVTQLATVSEVGQSVQTNASLSTLLTTASLTQAEQLIGQNILSADGKTSGTVLSVNVTSSGSTATLSSGAIVRLTSGVTVGA